MQKLLAGWRELIATPQPTRKCPIMRLLNVYNLKFAQFNGDDVPAYAITSHWWCDNETYFTDVKKGKNKKTEGFKKVEGFCRFVRDENERRNSLSGDGRCDWIWLDTACINKDSDAEVTGSINSMFR